MSTAWLRVLCLAAVVWLTAVSPVAADEVQTSEVAERTVSGGDQDEIARARGELSKLPWQILYEAYDEDNWEIFVMNADGSRKQNLTNTPGVHELYPQASPDGTRICFLADIERDGQTYRSVYVMDSDGSNRKLVAERARQPCWSPDGKRIAFVKQEFKRFNVVDYVSKGLFFCDLSTGEIAEHPNSAIEHLYNLAWSPNGEWIFSTVHGGLGYDHAIVAIEVNGQRIVKLPMPGCRPCVSRDGRRITWSPGGHEVATAEVVYGDDGPTIANQRQLDQGGESHLYHPDFSPDGQWVTYSVGPGGRMPAAGPGTHSEVAEMIGVRGPWNIHIRRADGTGPSIPLTSDMSMSNKESEWIARSAE